MQPPDLGSMWLQHVVPLGTRVLICHGDGGRSASLAVLKERSEEWQWAVCGRAWASLLGPWWYRTRLVVVAAPPPHPVPRPLRPPSLTHSRQV